MPEIKIGEIEVEVKQPLTLIYSGADVVNQPVKYGPDVVVLDPEACVYHAERVSELHELLPDSLYSVTGQKIEDFGSSLEWTYGVRHLVGRLDMTLKFMQLGAVKIAWKYPEAGLHPKWQLELSDLLIRWSKGSLYE